MHDYSEYRTYIKELEADKKELMEDNIRLKQEIRNLKTKIEVMNEDTGSSNSDLLRRLSNLEKIIYGKE